MVENNLFDEAKDIAITVARKVHRHYHTYFDVSDVSQELMVWVFKRNDKITEWLDHPTDSDEYKMGVRKLARTLTRHADKYCRRAKAQKAGYELRDEQFYDAITLSEMLPFAFPLKAGIVTTHDGNKPKVSGGGNPAEGGNYVVQLIDIRRALALLDPQDRLVLEMKLFEQLTFSEVAEMLEVSDTTAHRKVDGALRRLNNLLGGQSPFTDGVEP